MHDTLSPLFLLFSPPSIYLVSLDYTRYVFRSGPSHVAAVFIRLFAPIRGKNSRV